MQEYSLKLYICIYLSGALQITESDVGDQGKYECVANNSVGTEYSKSTTLYVKGMIKYSIVRKIIDNSGKKNNL